MAQRAVFIPDPGKHLSFGTARPDPQRCHSEARPRRSVRSHQRLQGRGIYRRITGGRTRQPVPASRLRHGRTGPVPSGATGHQQQTVDFSVGAQDFVRSDGAVWRLLRNDRRARAQGFLNGLSGSARRGGEASRRICSPSRRTPPGQRPGPAREGKILPPSVKILRSAPGFPAKGECRAAPSSE